MEVKIRLCREWEGGENKEDEEKKDGGCRDTTVPLLNFHPVSIPPLVTLVTFVYLLSCKEKKKKMNIYKLNSECKELVSLPVSNEEFMNINFKA